MSDAQFFLLLSGNRCGSTWLSFMLNALPDVRTEFECQWSETVPTHLHVAMGAAGFDLRQTLETMAADEASVLGSKMVVPGGISFSKSDHDRIRAVIPEDFKLVHISRKYIEAFLSRFRDAGHLINGEGLPPPPLSREWLRTDMASEQMKPQARCVDLDALVDNLTSRLAIDEFFCSFQARSGGRYLFLDYATIFSNFNDAVRHVGSSASADVVEEVLRKPPTKKLPSLDYKEIVENFDEVHAVGEEFEERRQEMLERAGVRLAT